MNKEIFTAISDARSRLIGAAGVAETARANNELSGALNRLLAISEAYPTLKADQNFRVCRMNWQERKIGCNSRKDYNDEYNSITRESRFPVNIIAGMFGYERREYFQADEGAEKCQMLNSTDRKG